MDKYHLQERIGGGRHSRVWKGRVKQTVEYVAIKRVEKAAGGHLQHEVKLLVALDHPNVIRFLTWYETTRHYWLVLEYCPGPSLMSLLLEDKLLPVDAIRSFASSVLCALQYIHSCGIVLNGLTSSKVLLGSHGSLKVTSFAKAVLLRDVSATVVHVGAPCYMSPELLCAGTCSMASDIYACACLMHEMFAGKPPFAGPSLCSVLRLSLEDGAPALGDGELADVTTRMLAKDPSQRIAWEALRAHPFWEGTIPNAKLPADIVHAPAPRVHYNTLATNASRNQEADALANDEEAGEGRLPRMDTVDAGDMQLRDFTDVVDFSPPAPNAPPLAAGEDSAPAAEAARSGQIGPAPPSATHEGGTRPSGALADTSAPPEESAMSAPPKDRKGKGAQSGRSEDSTSARSEGKDTAASLNREVVLKLMLDEADWAVRPIFLNKKIEKIPHGRFDPSALKFPPRDAKQLVAMFDEEGTLEDFFLALYKAMGTADDNGTPDQLASLRYFQSICSEVAVANWMINTSLTEACVDILRDSKNVVVKIEAACAIGMLVRYATYINASICDTGILGVLTDAARERNGDETVKRRALSALGELVFYVTARKQQSHETREWTVPNSAVNAIVSSLRARDDAILQHYAARTIDNVAAYDPEIASRFATREVVLLLRRLFEQGSGDLLRQTALSGVARLARLSPALLGPIMLEGVDPGWVLAELPSASTKTSLPLLTLLCCAILDGTPRIRSRLFEHPSFASSLVAVLSSSHALCRRKALVAVYLAMKHRFSSVVAACEVRLIPALERQSREKDEAALAALRLLVDDLLEAIPSHITLLLSDMDAVDGRTHPPPATVRRMRASATALRVCLHLASATTYRGRLWTSSGDVLLPALGSMLGRLWAGFAFLDPGECRDVVMALTECLVQDTAGLSDRSRTCIFDDITRGLAALLGACSEKEERFRALRTLILAVACPPSTDAQVGEKHGVLLECVLPLLPSMLQDSDAMAAEGQKLAATMLEGDPSLLAGLHRIGLVDAFLAYFDVSSPLSNVHNARVVQAIVASPGAERTVLDSGLPERYEAILRIAVEQGVPMFFGALFDIAVCLLEWGLGSGSALAREDVSRVHAIAICTPLFASGLLSCVGQEPHLASRAAEAMVLCVKFLQVQHISAIDSWSRAPVVLANAIRAVGVVTGDAESDAWLAKAFRGLLSVVHTVAGGAGGLGARGEEVLAALEALPASAVTAGSTLDDVLAELRRR